MKARDAGSVLVHANNGSIDHLHRRVMTGGQRIHDPVPKAGLPPLNETIIASGVEATGFGRIAPGALERETQKVPVTTRRSPTWGMPRQTDAFNWQTRTSRTSDINREPDMLPTCQNRRD
jgi:hypothetical protein